MSRLQLALVATDPITTEGISAALRCNSHVELVPNEITDADAGLVVAQETNGWVFSAIERLDAQFTSPGRPIVLVADSITEV